MRTAAARACAFACIAPTILGLAFCAPDDTRDAADTPAPPVQASPPEQADGSPDDDIAPAPDAPGPPGATARERCEAFRQDGLLVHARTRADFRDQLGEPARVDWQTEPNRHVADATDTVSVLHYPGLRAQVRTAQGRDLLEQVTVEDNRHLRFDEPAINTSESDLVSLLGEPDRRDTGRLYYECATAPGPEEPVSFRIAERRVRDVTFHHYVD
jgi:hypothetical protein